MFLLLYLLIFSCRLLPLASRDVTTPHDVIADSAPTPVAPTEVASLRAEVKKLRKSFLRFKRGGGMLGRKKLCEQASDQLSDKISVELSGLRSQLHMSDTMKSLRSELEYGLASLRSEMDNKVTSVRSELDTRLTDIRSELQGAVAELKTEVNSELTDIRAELQYNLNTACSGEKEITTALADMQSSLQVVKSDLESKVATSRAEMEQKVMGVRSELEAGMTTVQSQFKTDVVSVRADLQDMVSDVRTEMQDSVAGTRTELQTGFTAAQSGLQNTLNSMQADILAVTGQAKTDVATLRAEVSGMSAVVKAEVQTQLMETKTQMDSTMHTLEDDLGKQLGHVAKSVEMLADKQAQLNYNTSTLKLDLVQVMGEAEKGITSLRSDLEGEVKQLGSRLDDMVRSIRLDMERQAIVNISIANNNVSAINHRLNMLQNDVDMRLTNLRLDLDTKMGNVMTQVKDTRKKMAADWADQDSQLVTITSNISVIQEALANKAQELQKNSALSRGSTFIRWGRTACSEDSQLVYSGVVGGSSYDTDGGAANRLCLTLTPEAGNVTGARTYIYGAEYKFSEHHDMDVVCALCHSPLPVTIMIPGTQSCPPGWQVQYKGHLTAGMVGHRAASQYLCLDARPEHRPGSQEIRNGALFYYVFTECGSLPCPPYTNMYVSCVVCSR